MKATRKAWILSVGAVLLVAATVFTTVAYLTSTDAVTNTFTVGNVAITLDEAKVDLYGDPIPDADRVDSNTYKLIPGHTYTKDPTVHVADGSEDCWLFVKIENGLGTDGVLAMSDGWTAMEGAAGYYQYASTVAAGTDVPVFTAFTFGVNADPNDYVTLNESGEVTDTAAIVVTAYAIQSDGFTSAAEAWSAAGF